MCIYIVRHWHSTPISATGITQSCETLKSHSHVSHSNSSHVRPWNLIAYETLKSQSHVRTFLFDIPTSNHNLYQVTSKVKFQATNHWQTYKIVRYWKEQNIFEWVSEWVSEWVFFSANSAIYQLFHGEKKLIFNEMMMRSPLY